jgi:hypothetical protein
MSENEIPIEEWVDRMTKAHNHHAKAIEILEQRGRSLNERLESCEVLLADVHRSFNKVLNHLDITIEEDE